MEEGKRHEKITRNKELVAKRLQDPKLWSFAALGKLYNLHKTTVEEIFKRDVKKYRKQSVGRLSTV